MMSKPFRIILVVSVVVIFVVLLGLSLRTSRARDALQRYLAELRSQGEKLTYAELTSSRSTNQNFSLATITNAVWRLQRAPVNPGEMEFRMAVAPGQARVLWLEPYLAGGWNRGTSSVVSWQAFQTQMDNSAGALDEIREALRDPAPDGGPRKGLLSGPVSPFVAIRTAGQMLAGAVINSLHQTNRQEALQNLTSLIALARLNRDEYTLVSQMIRAAIVRLGVAASWEALQAPGWTEPELQQLQQPWEGIDLLDGLEKGFLGERALHAELWAAGFDLRSLGSRQTSGGKTPGPLAVEELVNDYVMLPAYRLTSINEDELFFLKSMEQTLEGIRSLKARRPWKKSSAGFAATMAEINRVANSPGRFRYWVSLIAIPNFTRAGETAARAETERQMTLASVALMRFQLRYGKAAPGLVALVPEFLGSVPYDCMSGEPLRYRLKPDGTFVLYSVGEDGRDDGGDPTPVTPKRYDLWEGRDAVWPAPASAERMVRRP